MNELIRTITEKTGIPSDKAETAANVVIDFLKEKLPDSFAAQIDSILKGGSQDDLTEGSKTIIR